MLMKVSTAGIVHETDAGLGARSSWCDHGLWPLALAVGLHHRDRAARSSSPARSTCWSACGCARPLPNLRGVFRFARTMGTWAMLEVLLLGVFVAYTKLGDLVHIELGPAVYALGLLTVVVRVGRNRARPRRGVGGDRAARPDACADARQDRRSTSGPARSGCEACGLVERARTSATARLPALRRGAASSASPTASTAPGPS